jgi:hypothetical protein
MLVRRDDSKLLAVPQHSENDVAHLVHDRAQRHHLGLGLPLALSIMRGQNGDIEVTGNTFTLKFYREKI